MSVGLSETLWKCVACNKTFKSIEMLDEHKKSKKHKRSEKEYRAANPTLPESSIFKSFCNEVSQASSFLSDLQRSVNGPEKEVPAVEEDAEKTPEPVKTTLDSLRICLFCNKDFDGVKKNLDHMHIKHNFFLLDIECLVNLKGLLSYLAERIQLGSMCLHCSKQFRSPHRCQQHMSDKGHCMMNEDDEAEFQAYYDYALQYENMGLPMEKPLEAPKKEKVEGEQDGNESWEDCDLEDAEEAEDDEDEDEKAKEGDKVEEGKLEMVVEDELESSTKTTESVTIVNADEESKTTEEQKTESATLVGGSAATETESNSVIDTTTDVKAKIGGQDHSSIGGSQLEAEDTPSIGSFDLEEVLKRR